MASWIYFQLSNLYRSSFKITLNVIILLSDFMSLEFQDLVTNNSDLSIPNLIVTWFVSLHAQNNVVICQSNQDCDAIAPFFIYFIYFFNEISFFFFEKLEVIFFVRTFITTKVQIIIRNFTVKLVIVTPSRCQNDQHKNKNDTKRENEK